MNFLSEVLSSATETEIDSLNTRIPAIQKQIANYKTNVEGSIKEVYQEFREWPKKNQCLFDSAISLTDEIAVLEKRIEDVTLKGIASQVNRLDGLSEELAVSKIALDVIVHLMRANELFLDFKGLLAKHMYKAAAIKLAELDECLQDVSDDVKTEAISSLQKIMYAEKGQLITSMIDLFQEYVKLGQSKNGAVQTNSIKIKKDNEKLLEVFSVLDLCGEISRPLGDFARFVYLKICKPITHGITTIKIETNGCYYTLTVAFKKSTVKAPYRDVFKRLLEIFRFIHLHLNYTINDNKKIVKLIGNELCSDLLETIINDCLSDSLSDSKSYKTVIEDIKKFQNELIELEILNSDRNPILDYANNMDIVFINKKCHEFLSMAICHMKKDLHDMIEVGVSKNGGSYLSIGEFPQSSISRNTLEILALAVSILDVALLEPEHVAARLICTVQSIFYQYGNIVCGHHERLLQTIPQQVALFRNNCMFIAHRLCQINETYAGKFPPSVLPSPPLFTDQAHQLNTIGGEVFLAYVEEQVQNMENTLQEHQFNSVQLSQKLSPDIDKCIRQCIRQYEILKTVWFNVLPVSVYNKTLGYLLNTFCKKLIDIVVNTEDLPAENAEQLIEMFRIIVTRGPKLFADGDEVCLFVEAWQKFNELIFILGARMIDIANRWAEGKGPLTIHFTAEEMRRLIKALFQNTDLRASVLSKIHN